MRRAGRQRAVGALPRFAHEGAGAIGGGGGDAGPGAAPQQVRHRHHGPGMNLVVAHRQDLLAGGGGDELETGAAGAAHAERVPAELPFERIVLLQENDENLVGARRLGRTPRRGHDSVGGFAVRDHRGASFQRDARVVPLDRGGAVADVTAAFALGGRGRQQHLLAAQPAQQTLMPGAAGAMPGNASNLGLVHRVNHRRGGAGAAERITDIGDIGDAGALAAELARHRDAHEARGARGGHRLGRKARLVVDGCGMLRGDRCDLLDAGGESFHSCRNGRVRCDLQAPRRVRGGRNALQLHSSQFDGCAHHRLMRHLASTAITVAQEVLQNFQFLVAFVGNCRASFV